MLAQFDAYGPLVAKGSYLVFEDTIVNGHPVWPSFGPGPAEAAVHALMRNADFEKDEAISAQMPSFNRGGYLRRVNGPDRPPPADDAPSVAARVAARSRPVLSSAKKAAKEPVSRLRRR
jgi:hypothetical protein